MVRSRPESYNTFCPRPESCDIPRVLMSITPNLCCDETELRRIHQPDSFILFIYFLVVFFFFFGCTPKPSAVRAGVLITELPGNSQECFYTFTSFINVLLDEQILSSAFSQLQHGWLKFMKIMSSHTYILLENVKPFHIMVNNLS